MRNYQNLIPNIKESSPAPTNWRGLGWVVAIIVAVLASAVFVQVSDLIAMHGGNL